MISENELFQAINTLESCKNPTYDTVKKLADFYVVKNELYGASSKSTQSEVSRFIIKKYGESDFCAAITGLKMDHLIEIMDELMDTLHVTKPLLYKAVLRKLQG